VKFFATVSSHQMVPGEGSPAGAAPVSRFGLEFESTVGALIGCLWVVLPPPPVPHLDCW